VLIRGEAGDRVAVLTPDRELIFRSRLQTVTVTAPSGSSLGGEVAENVGRGVGRYIDPVNGQEKPLNVETPEAALLNAIPAKRGPGQPRKESVSP